MPPHDPGSLAVCPPAWWVVTGTAEEHARTNLFCLFLGNHVHMWADTALSTGATRNTNSSLIFLTCKNKHETICQYLVFNSLARYPACGATSHVSIGIPHWRDSSWRDLLCQGLFLQNTKPAIRIIPLQTRTFMLKQEGRHLPFCLTFYMHWHH